MWPRLRQEAEVGLEATLEEGEEEAPGRAPRAPGAGLPHPVPEAVAGVGPGGQGGQEEARPAREEEGATSTFSTPRRSSARATVYPGPA